MFVEILSVCNWNITSTRVGRTNMHLYVNCAVLTCCTGFHSLQDLSSQWNRANTKLWIEPSAESQKTEQQWKLKSSIKSSRSNLTLEEKVFPLQLLTSIRLSLRGTYMLGSTITDINGVSFQHQGTRQELLNLAKKLQRVWHTEHYTKDSVISTRRPSGSENAKSFVH